MLMMCLGEECYGFVGHEGIYLLGVHTLMQIYTPIYHFLYFTY